MFCPECGATDKKMIGNICINCFLKNYKMLNIPNKIEVEICSHCNSRLEEGKWYESNLPEEEIIYRALERNIQINDEVEDEIIDLEINQLKGKIAECSVEIIAKVYEQTLEEKHKTTVKIIKTSCPYCSKIQSGYFESVIQFRANNRIIENEEYDIAKNIVKNTLNKQYKTDKLAYCPQIAKLKEGYDFYIGSLKSGRKVVNALKDNFGGIIKESPRLISEDKSTGKGLYRIWISIRIPEFKINDIIQHEKNIIKVTDIDKNRVQGIDLENSKKITIPWREFENMELIKKYNEIQTTNIISKSPSIIQILDPTDYSTINLNIKKEYKNYQIGDEVKIIKIKNSTYLM